MGGILLIPAFLAGYFILAGIVRAFQLAGYLIETALWLRRTGGNSL